MSGIVFFKSADVLAASQFLGTELSARPGKAQKMLRVKEILLNMGGEAKDWAIVKSFSQGGGTVSVPILSASASTVANVAIRGTDADVLLLAGEQIQCITTGATSAMHIRVQYEETNNAPERLPNDPSVTR